MSGRGQTVPNRPGPPSSACLHSGEWERGGDASEARGGEGRGLADISFMLHINEPHACSGRCPAGGVVGFRALDDDREDGMRSRRLFRVCCGGWERGRVVKGFNDPPTGQPQGERVAPLYPQSSGNGAPPKEPQSKSRPHHNEGWSTVRTTTPHCPSRPRGPGR